MNEIIPTRIAAEILNLNVQYVRDLMRDGKLDIGLYIPKKSRNGHATIRVYRAKLARHLGREPNYVWEQETMQRM